MGAMNGQIDGPGRWTPAGMAAAAGAGTRERLSPRLRAHIPTSRRSANVKIVVGHGATPNTGARGQAWPSASPRSG